MIATEPNKVKKLVQRGMYPRYGLTKQQDMLALLHSIQAYRTALPLQDYALGCTGGIQLGLPTRCQPESLSAPTKTRKSITDPNSTLI